MDPVEERCLIAVSVRAVAQALETFPDQVPSRGFFFSFFFFRR